MAIVLLHVSAFTPHLSGIDPTVFKKVQNVLGQGVLVVFRAVRLPDGAVD